MRRALPARSDTSAERTDEPQHICPAEDRFEEVVSAVRLELTRFAFRTRFWDSKTQTIIDEMFERQVENSTPHLETFTAGRLFTRLGQLKNEASRRTACSGSVPIIVPVAIRIALGEASTGTIGVTDRVGDGR